LLKNREGLSRLTVAHIQDKHIAELPRNITTPILDLPHLDTVNNGPPPIKQPEPIEPEQVALSLFNPMGINKLANELSIGSTKAKRVKTFADGIRKWAKNNGQSDNYCFVTNDWIEV
jgi:hypothetical protein